jgi:hypothetical protein
METEKKLQTMEEELKLIKGELKQSLASVRDYLLNMELPSSEFATVLEDLGDDSGNKVTLRGSLASEEPRVAQELPQEEPVEPAFEQTGEEIMEPEAELPPEEEEMMHSDESPEDELEQPLEDEVEDFEPEEPEEPIMPESELPVEEEPQMVPGKSLAEAHAEAGQSTPKVNLLANLMHWVTKAKKEIGTEHLPAFLEVYGISGHLSLELKELILHMANIASEQTENGNTAEAWSQAMLSLHGILTGGDAPLHPVKAFWHDEDTDETAPDEEEEEEVTEVEPEKPKDMPLKLKLVFPNAEGKSQEFCLDLKPEVADDDSHEAPSRQERQSERGDVRWPQKQLRKKK